MKSLSVILHNESVTCRVFTSCFNLLTVLSACTARFWNGNEIHLYCIMSISNHLCLEPYDHIKLLLFIICSHFDLIIPFIYFTNQWKVPILRNADTNTKCGMTPDRQTLEWRHPRLSHLFSITSKLIKTKYPRLSKVKQIYGNLGSIFS